MSNDQKDLLVSDSQGPDLLDMYNQYTIQPSYIPFNIYKYFTSFSPKLIMLCIQFHKQLHNLV